MRHATRDLFYHRRRGWAGRRRQKNAYAWECKQKLRRGSTSVCKGGAKEYCNRIWEFILRRGLALPQPQGMKQRGCMPTPTAKYNFLPSSNRRSRPQLPLQPSPQVVCKIRGRRATRAG